MSSQAAFTALHSRLRQRVDEILCLPDGEFVAAETPLHNSILQSMAREGLVDQLRQSEYKQAKRDWVWIYEVPADVRDTAEQYRETRDAICPCGHSGVENHGDHYECGFEHCDREFTRDELEVGE